jgi:hypothetical protein
MKVAETIFWENGRKISIFFADDNCLLFYFVIISGRSLLKKIGVTFFEATIFILFQDKEMHYEGILKA